MRLGLVRFARFIARKIKNYINSNIANLLQNKHRTYIKIGKIKKKHKHETNYWKERETNSSVEMN